MEIIPWNEQRGRIFLDRYAKKDSKGDPIETSPHEMWYRIASQIADDWRERDLFLEILKDFQFVPSGRIMTGGQTLYNCFVQGFPIRETGADSRENIMKTISDMVEITSRGGGVGINWSVLRPRDTYIRGVDSKSSGSISWMRGCDEMANAIRQGGTRTAALMFMLDIWHPDIIEFTRTGSRFERANYSVNVSNKFMKALKEDANWDLIFPDTISPFYDREWDGDIETWKSKQLPIIVHKTVKASDLWRALTESAYSTGNPGIAFMDVCNTWSNTKYLHKLICFNPCGEQPLPMNGSCNLGAINLLSCVEKDGISWDKLRMLIKYSVRFLDRVIDVDKGVTPEIDALQKQVRRVGLGTMGLADVLILRNLRYGSNQSIRFIHQLYSFIRDAAYSASVELAEEKGQAPGFNIDKILESRYIYSLSDNLKWRIQEHGLRNLALLTSAPTGTTSILAGASSGIEPIFSRSYTRKDATGCSLVEHPLAHMPQMVTALEIPVEEHIQIQAAIQLYMDSSISKTINLPENSTVKDVSNAFQMAYDSGCKGVTVYRSTGENDVLCETCNI